MTAEQSGLLLGICGLGGVCLGLLVVAALAILRLTGRNLLAFLPLLASRGSAKGDTPGTRRFQRRRINLRERARAVDFDEALARHAPGAMPPEPDRTIRPAAAPLDAYRPGPVEPRRQAAPDEDEIFGGLLDVDGDGDPDI